MDIQQVSYLPSVVEEVEKDLLKHIIANMEEGKITVEESQQLARDFLALLPVNDKEELLQKLNKLGKTHSEVQAVYLDLVRPHEEAIRQQKLTQMSEHIKQGNIEQAISIAKGEQ